MPEKVDKGTAGPEVKALKNYPGLCGRLLLASATRESDVVLSIIDPSTDIGVDLSGATISENRTYNPITERLSHAERAAAWQGVGFDQAYQQWKKEFTQVINGITPTETNRLTAFRAVFNAKPPAEFTQADAETLYKRFCQGESNVDDFVKTVIGNLKAEKRTIDDALLKDLEWVSRKLFGKQTAIAVSRIIELETEMSDNPKDFVRVLFKDPTRINNLNIEETNILAYLHDGLKAEPIVESSNQEPHASAQPAETKTEDTEKAREELAALVPPADGASEEDRRAFEIKKDQLLERANLRFGSAVWNAPAGDFPITIIGLYPKGPDGNWYFLADIYNPKTGLIEKSSMGVPINKVIYLETNATAEAPAQPVVLDELVAPIAPVQPAAEPEPARPRIKVPLYSGIKIQKDGIVYDVGSMSAQEKGHFKFVDPKSGQTLEVDQQQLENYVNDPNSGWVWLNASDFGAQIPTPEDTGAVELQGKDFAGELNANLLNQTNPDATFSIPIETVKGYLTSVAGNRLIYEGNLTVDKNHNTIIIKGLKIDGGLAGGKITLDLSITNSSKGISAQIQNYDGRGLARGTVEQKVGTLDSTFREMVDALVVAQNPAWKSNSIEISGERIKINFHNTKSTTGNLPS